jgi:hypothetical protein
VEVGDLKRKPLMTGFHGEKIPLPTEKDKRWKTGF